MSALVQAILVPKGDHPHEDVVMACATASVKALLFTRENPAWDEWLSGPFTKSVRRATITQFDDALEWVAAAAQVGDVQTVALPPMAYDDFPKCVAKTQVQGTDYPRRGSWDPHPDLLHHDPMVVINPNVEMTTGKMAAQVAHGLMASVLRYGKMDLSKWMERGLPWGCFVCTEQEWDVYVKRCPIHIEDAGFTEVEPGTLTVVAR